MITGISIIDYDNQYGAITAEKEKVQGTTLTGKCEKLVHPKSGWQLVAAFKAARVVKIRTLMAGRQCQWRSSPAGLLFVVRTCTPQVKASTLAHTCTRRNPG